MQRVVVTMSEEDKEWIVNIAKKEDRFIGQQVMHMVKAYVKLQHSGTKPIRKVKLPVNWQIIKG